jgi:hypothetical protein
LTWYIFLVNFKITFMIISGLNAGVKNFVYQGISREKGNWNSIFLDFIRFSLSLGKLSHNLLIIPYPRCKDLHAVKYDSKSHLGLVLSTELII